MIVWQNYNYRRDIMEWVKIGLSQHRLRLVRVVAQHRLSTQASRPREKPDLSALLSSRAVLSAESRERCVARIIKMKSMRPPGADLDVKRRAAVLGELALRDCVTP